MNIHEHQAKEILRDYGAPVSNGVVIFSPNEIKNKILERSGFDEVFHGDKVDGMDSADYNSIKDAVHSKLRY